MADKKEEAQTDESSNELQKMLDQVVDNAHSRLDMAADILRAAVSSIPPEELAKVLLAATPPATEPAAEPAPTANAAPATETPAEEAPAAEAPKEEKKEG